MIYTNGIDFILDAVKGTSYDRMRLVYLDKMGGIGKWFSPWASQGCAYNFCF